jgi:hypothetical protein
MQQRQKTSASNGMGTVLKRHQKIKNQVNEALLSTLFMVPLTLKVIRSLPFKRS